MNNLHVYTGDGKGKTTAAMGLALRGLGHGRKVLVAQFMKNGVSGELSALTLLPGAHVVTAPPTAGFVSRMSPDKREETAREQLSFARETEEIIRRERPETIVLDEINVALSLGMLSAEAGAELINTALESGETVATGRNAPDWLREKADYVSVIMPEKHPYATRKQPARKGVEW